MARSMIRSSVKSKWDYRSMLVGYNASLPLAPTMFLPGEGYSTAINKMLYSNETMSLASATLAMSVNTIVGFANGSISGYSLYGGSNMNKYSLATDSNFILSYTVPTSLAGTYRGGIIPNTAAYYTTNTGSGTSTLVVNKWDFSTDTVTATSTALQSFSNIGAFGQYTFSNNPSIYFGGGNPPGPAYYGGLLKFNTSTSTASSVWADSTATSRAQTAGAENGSVGAYIGGGYSMPYVTLPTNILKITYATDTSYSTLAATLSSSRAPARVGVQAGVCAYYAGGRTSSSSVATSSTTIDKLTYSTETRSILATASIDRNGLTTWNT